MEKQRESVLDRGQVETRFKISCRKRHSKFDNLRSDESKITVEQIRPQQCDPGVCTAQHDFLGAFNVQKLSARSRFRSQGDAAVQKRSFDVPSMTNGIVYVTVATELVSIAGFGPAFGRTVSGVISVPTPSRGEWMAAEGINASQFTFSLCRSLCRYVEGVERGEQCIVRLNSSRL